MKIKKIIMIKIHFLILSLMHHWKKYTCLKSLEILQSFLGSVFDTRALCILDSAVYQQDIRRHPPAVLVTLLRQSQRLTILTHQAMTAPEGSRYILEKI